MIISDYKNLDGTRALVRPAINLGKDAARSIDDRFKDLRSKFSIEPRPKSHDSNRTLEERLYESKASFKIYASQVSMHLGRPWLTKLFSQIDSALDVDEWDPRDPPPTILSASTFIRMLLTLKVIRKPGMGVSNSGNFVAAWTVDKNRLTIECLASDRVRWVLSRERNGEIERAAGEGKIERLRAFLEPYDPSVWFDYAK